MTTQPPVPAEVEPTEAHLLIIPPYPTDADVLDLVHASDFTPLVKHVISVAFDDAAHYRRLIEGIGKHHRSFAAECGAVSLKCRTD